MPFRETLLNLAITAVLVLIVVLGGLLMKETRPEAKPGRRIGQTATNTEPAREARTEFEVLPRVELVESRANEADTLRVRVRGEEHVFVLYFVDALEASMNHPQQVAAQGRYFGRAPDRLITQTGAEAAVWVTELLKTRPFQVYTRWEQVASTGRYYAVVVVETESGRPEYLANLLIKQGYAWVGGVDTPLPGDEPDIPTYIVGLQKLAAQAREEKRGIWAKLGR